MLSLAFLGNCRNNRDSVRGDYESSLPMAVRTGKLLPRRNIWRWLKPHRPNQDHIGTGTANCADFKCRFKCIGCLPTLWMQANASSDRSHENQSTRKTNCARPLSPIRVAERTILLCVHVRRIEGFVVTLSRPARKEHARPHSTHVEEIP
jgi:hypothetical protein